MRVTVHAWDTLSSGFALLGFSGSNLSEFRIYQEYKKTLSLINTIDAAILSDEWSKIENKYSGDKVENCYHNFLKFLQIFISENSIVRTSFWNKHLQLRFYPLDGWFLTFYCS